jgi:hypothetical protein
VAVVAVEPEAAAEAELAAAERVRVVTRAPVRIPAVPMVHSWAVKIPALREETQIPESIPHRGPGQTLRHARLPVEWDRIDTKRVRLRIHGDWRSFEYRSRRGAETDRTRSARWRCCRAAWALAAITRPTARRTRPTPVDPMTCGPRARNSDGATVPGVLGGPSDDAQSANNSWVARSKASAALTLSSATRPVSRERTS